MERLNLKKDDKIKIEGIDFLIDKLIERNYMAGNKMDKKVSYYTYRLSSNDKKIKHASIDYLNSDNIVFHLTKNIVADIYEKEIIIEGGKYHLIKLDECIFLNENGEISKVKEYKISGNKTEITPSELHVLPSGEEIFYSTIQLFEKDLIF